VKYFHHPTKKDGDIGDVAIPEDRVILTTSKQLQDLVALQGGGIANPQQVVRDICKRADSVNI